MLIICPTKAADMIALWAENGPATSGTPAGWGFAVGKETDLPGGTSGSCD